MADFIIFITNFVNSFGYLGIFIATALEYACFPLSSEILLPFIGYSVYVGQLSLPIAVFFSTAGAAVGCSFCYAVGRFGRSVIENVLCSRFSAIKEGIEKAEAYFNEIGRQSVFMGRLMPIVRTYISFPAGMTRMKYSIFLLFSVSGALLWNIILISLGYCLGEHWQNISQFFTQNKSQIIMVVIILVVFSIHKKRRKTTAQN